MPRKDKTIKRGFKPKLDVLLFADYAAIEYRVAAFYQHSVGFPEWADNFKQGIDPHWSTAARLLDKQDLSDEERQLGKKYNFGALYGAGPDKIGKMLKAEGIPLPVGKSPQDLWHDYYRQNPGLRVLSNPKPRWPDRNWVPGRLEQRLEEVGHVKTLWGRELHPILRYKILNYICQGCAADLLRCAMVKLHDFLQDFESHLVLQVHDELQLDCITSEIPTIVAALPGLMSDDRIASVVPVEVEIEISHDTWATKEEYRV